jgi:outer membrane biosynthesis protein TonB
MTFYLFRVGTILWFMTAAYTCLAGAEDKRSQVLGVRWGWEYPKDADGTRPEGTVVVQVCVAKSDSVDKATILQSSGHDWIK